MKKIILAILLVWYSAIETMCLLLGYGILPTSIYVYIGGFVGSIAVLGHVVEKALYPIRIDDDPSSIIVSIRGMVLYFIPIMIAYIIFIPNWRLGLSLILYIAVMVRAIWRATHMEWVM